MFTLYYAQVNLDMGRPASGHGGSQTARPDKARAAEKRCAGAHGAYHECVIVHAHVVLLVPHCWQEMKAA